MNFVRFWGKRLRNGIAWILALALLLAVGSQQPKLLNQLMDFNLAMVKLLCAQAPYGIGDYIELVLRTNQNVAFSIMWLEAGCIVEFLMWLLWKAVKWVFRAKHKAGAAQPTAQPA